MIALHLCHLLIDRCRLPQVSPEAKQASMQQDTSQTQKRLHRRQIVSSGVCRAEQSHMLLPNTTDISTEQDLVGSNHTGCLSHFLRSICEVISYLFSHRNAAITISLAAVVVSLQAS